MKNAKALFLDNGMIILVLGDYAHYYDYADQAANDYNLYMTGSDTSTWDNNEMDTYKADAERIEGDTIGVLIMTDEQINSYLDVDASTAGCYRDRLSAWGSNVEEFLETLKNLIAE